MCMANLSMLTPSGPNDQNMNASPLLGLYATDPLAQAEREGSTCWPTFLSAQWLAAARKESSRGKFTARHRPSACLLHDAYLGCVNQGPKAAADWQTRVPKLLLAVSCQRAAPSTRVETAVPPSWLLAPTNCDTSALLEQRVMVCMWCCF